jgi:hypothetical protein
MRHQYSASASRLVEGANTFQISMANIKGMFKGLLMATYHQKHTNFLRACHYLSSISFSFEAIVFMPLV